jgi:hypothetical protein
MRTIKISPVHRTGGIRICLPTRRDLGAQRVWRSLALLNSFPESTAHQAVNRKACAERHAFSTRGNKLLAAVARAFRPLETAVRMSVLVRACAGGKGVRQTRIKTNAFQAVRKTRGVRLADL